MYRVVLYAGEWVTGSGFSYDECVDWLDDGASSLIVSHIPETAEERGDFWTPVYDLYRDQYSKKELAAMTDDSETDVRLKAEFYKLYDDGDAEDAEPEESFCLWQSRLAREILED